MYLKDLYISGFKLFASEFKISFNNGLSVLVGENGVGKSAIIDALRHLLLEDEFGRTGISDSDFYRPFILDARSSESIRLTAKFSSLSETEKVAFLPWTELNDEAHLNLQIDNKVNNQGRYHRVMWGGASRNSIFEWELMGAIHCIYLPPLRDAEAKLREGKGSRLARLLKNLNKEELEKAKLTGNPLPMEQSVKSFNESLSVPGTIINQANELIRTSLKEAIGEYFGQDTAIQFSETNFNNIVESLRLLFFPKTGLADNKDLFRSLEENSLGYNNLLYLATILAEFTNKSDNTEHLKILLIEEPEAHLHPQLQIRLLKYLEEKAKDANVQIIVTTHSPVLSAAVSTDTIIHLAVVGDVPIATPVKNCGLLNNSKAFLARWLDITKSVLFYSRGVILVEGIAEAMLLPELAKRIIQKYNETAGNGKKIPDCLEDAGISVINMNGIYFQHFMQLFCNIIGGDFINIPVRCAGITDNDPPKEEKPTNTDRILGENPALEIVDKVNQSTYCRLYASRLKTFEYDLAMEGGNLNLMISSYLEILDTSGSIRKEYENLQNKNWALESDDTKSEVAYNLLSRIENNKGEYAQILASKLTETDQVFDVPEYIKKAVLWACGEEKLNMPTKNEKFDHIALKICGKPKDVTPEECFLARGASGLVCRNYKKCRIWEKSDEQLDYILYHFNTSSFLMACAGSGKTEVVGFKAAYERSLWKKTYAGIAVLTFTNNAAAIIQERASQVAGASIGYPHFIGTFDSWLHRYFANPFIHLITGYQGREGDHSLRLVEDRMDAAFLNAFKTTYQYWRTDQIKANEFFYLDLIRQEIVFSSSNANIDRTRNQACLEDWQKKDLLNTKERFWKAGFVTYQDVEHLCYTLLSNQKDASKLISSRFPVIIIDECQDLAWPQLQILQKLIDNGTIIHFVGDLNQGIYSFRKVDPVKVGWFADHNRFSKLQLTHNFRSLQPIVDLSGKLVAQSSIKGEKNSGSEPTCLCLTYKKNEIQKLSDSFILYVDKKFDLDKCAVITRNNSTVAKLRPGVSSKITKAMLPAIAIHIWKLPNISIEQRKEALTSLGKFVASAYFSGQSIDRNNQSCPEEIRSKIKWRLFLSDTLKLCCNNSLLSNPETTWKDWAKAFRETINDIISECSRKNEIIIDFEQAEKYTAPRGESDQKVSSTTETIHCNPSQPVRITNFHQIKGETLESVMVVSSPTNQGGGEGYWKNWLNDPTSENARFAYVASTRPKKLLIWAVPDRLDQTDKDKLQSLGFVITDTL